MGYVGYVGYGNVEDSNSWIQGGEREDLRNESESTPRAIQGVI